VMGKLGSQPAVIELADPPYPFSAPFGEPRPADGPPSGSTVEALAQVEFLAGYDLDGQHPYEDLEVKPVLLVRRELQAWSGTRQVILLFDASTHDRHSAASAPPETAIGVLRPVQRYVLRAGLVRARELYDAVLSSLEDPWGFVRVRKGEAPKPVTVTPPILEQLPPGDWEYGPDRPEFLVCDGNHRVVELVWNGRLAVPAVAVAGTPKEPYYARPFSQYEWDCTAGNVLDRSPDQASKYAVRAVDLAALDPVSAARLAAKPEAERYRRYYRDLTTGFGYMGGQGGRYV
jgi:hypothetical protein